MDWLLTAIAVTGLIRILMNNIDKILELALSIKKRWKKLFK